MIQNKELSRCSTPIKKEEDIIESTFKIRSQVDTSFSFTINSRKNGSPGPFLKNKNSKREVTDFFTEKSVNRMDKSYEKNR